MMKGEKGDTEERGRIAEKSSKQSGPKWADWLLVPTGGVNETTLGWVLRPPVPPTVAEKKRGEAAAFAPLKTLAAELKHGRHVALGLVGSGTLKQKMG